MNGKTNLIIAALVMLILASNPARAQNPAPILSFRNDTKQGLILQGTSKVNHLPRRGQLLLIAPGRTGYDNNVPPGIRYINIYDARQPSRILLADFPVNIQSRDLSFIVYPSPASKDRVILVPE